MSRLPTPDELGGMLKAGKITREEAIEIMDRRAREEAFAQDRSPAQPSPGQHPSSSAEPVAEPVAEPAGEPGSLQSGTGEAGRKLPGKGREAGPRGERRNDLIVEHWQAPGGGGGSRSLRGDGRELWEYEQESLGPSRELIFTIVLVVGAILGLIALLVYGIMYLHRSFSVVP